MEALTRRGHHNGQGGQRPVRNHGVRLSRIFLLPYYLKFHQENPSKHTCHAKCDVCVFVYGIVNLSHDIICNQITSVVLLPSGLTLNANYIIHLF